MKKLVAGLLSLCSTFLFAQHKNVLFIGNSYTYVNDLPNTFRQLALSGGDSITVDNSTFGGYTFQNHCGNSTTLSKIAAGNWDYVILQEQSQIPSFPQSQVETDCYPYAKQLDSLVNISNPCAETVFYMTWGRKYGDAGNCGIWPPVCTFSGMQDQLRYSYLKMAQDNHAGVIPAGEAWRKAWFSDSTINLWSGDNSHPSTAGTYLTACVFYAGIFEKTPVGLNYISTLTNNEANFLQQIAHDVVFDSLLTWQIHIDHPQISYSINQTGADQFELTVNGTNYDELSIVFNNNQIDDSTSQLNFPGPGNYTAEILSSNNCFQDTITITIENTVSGTDDPDYPHIEIFPNPVSSLLQINGINRKFIYEIFDISGRIMMRGQSEKYIDCTELPAGVYFLRLNNQKNFRMIRQ